MSTLSLHDLPAEILESILVVQPPETVCAVACTSRALSAAASPVVWRSIAKRVFRTDPAPEDATAAGTRAVAAALICAWWAASGALVRGVPVHFRRRFVAVRERGSTALVRIRAANNEAALVLGTDEEHGPHAPKPALEMDFALDAKGPYPVDGFVIRIIGAPVPSSPSSPPSSPLARSPSFRSPPAWAPIGRAMNPRTPPRSPTIGGPPRLPRASHLRSQSARRCDVMTTGVTGLDEDVSATVRVLLNGAVIGMHTVTELCVFKHVDIEIAAKLLRCKPRMNTLAIEYVEHGSTAAYWLKEVRMVPKVLPMQAPAPVDNVPLRHVGRSSHDITHQKKDQSSLNKYRRANTHFSLDRIMGC